MTDENRQTLKISRRLSNWLRHDLIGLAAEMRWRYVPPLMVYFAAGVSGFTGIVESFFVKEQLGLSAAFLAGLGFWAGLPWALKMPVGHLVDIFWRWKAGFVYLGDAETYCVARDAAVPTWTYSRKL